MSRPNPESLRRMVSDLAGLHADDISAILADLKPAERQAVEDLLREHAAYFEAPPTDMQAEMFDAARLSPWLLQRLRGEGRFAHAVTGEARQALLAAAIAAAPRGGAISGSKARP